jgi:hypothetical protein
MWLFQFRHDVFFFFFFGQALNRRRDVAFRKRVDSRRRRLGNSLERREWREPECIIVCEWFGFEEKLELHKNSMRCQGGQVFYSRREGPSLR